MSSASRRARTAICISAMRYSALLNADMARETGGRLLLRIEDIDAPRCRPEYEAAIYEDLAWLGIAWEQPVRRQSEHFDDYESALAKLDAQGLLYPSFESRGEIARAGRRARPLRPLAARSRRRAALSGPRPQAAGGRAQAPHRRRRALRAAARHGCGGGARRPARPGPRPAPGRTARPAPSPPRRCVGRRHPGAQGNRRPAITSPSWWTTPRKASPMWCAGTICSGDQHPPPAAGAARPAGAALSSSPADSRRRRPQAVEIDAGHGLARVARRRRHAAGYPAHGRARPLAHDLDKPFELVLFGPPPWHAERGAGGPPWRDRRPKKKVRREARRDAGRRDARRRRARSRRRSPAFAHDIRTPLTGILALAELLASSDLGERERRWAAGIKSGADHLAALTTLDRRCAPRPTPARSRCSNEPFSPRRLIEALADALVARAETKGLNADVTIADDLPAMLAGDAVRLRAALENLARQRGEIHRARRGRLDARAARAARGRVKLIFTRHRQRHRPDARRDQAAVPPVRAGERGDRAPLWRRRPRPRLRQTLAKPMGGDLTVTSTPGRGASFRLATCCRSRPPTRRAMRARAATQRRRAASRFSAPRTTPTAAS